MYPKISLKKSLPRNTKLMQEVFIKYKDVVMFGFKTHYGGGRSTGFCLIYDAHQYLLKYEPRYRLQRVKM